MREKASVEKEIAAPRTQFTGFARIHEGGSWSAREIMTGRLFVEAVGDGVKGTLLLSKTSTITEFGIPCILDMKD